MEEVKTNWLAQLVIVLVMISALLLIHFWLGTQQAIQHNKELEKAYMYGYTDGALNAFNTTRVTKSKARFLFHKRMDSLLYRNHLNNQ